MNEHMTANECRMYVCQRTNDSAFNVGDGFARIALDQLLANDLAGLEQ